MQKKLLNYKSINAFGKVKEIQAEIFFNNNENSQLDLSGKIKEIESSNLIEFSHAWYKRDDKPPSVKEGLEWRDHLQKLYPKIKNFVFVHGHVHVPRHQVIENLTILCQGATGLPFDRDQRGSVAFLNVKDKKINWDVIRYEYNKDITSAQLEKRKPPFYTNLKNTIRLASIRNDL